MTPQELKAVFRLVLRTSVPVVSLSMCGALPASKQTPPTDPSILSDALSDLARARSLGPCGSEADAQVRQDPNYARSPLDRKVVRRLSEAQYERWKQRGRKTGPEFCTDACIGDAPQGLAALKLSDESLARVRIRRAVVSCLPATGKSGPTVTCAETWTITGTDCSAQRKLEFRPPAEEREWRLEPGRRPGNWRPIAHLRAHGIGDHLARLATFEAASVPAFLTLRDELAHHGAPLEFRERAEQFADDEIRHAQMMTALARRFGVEPELPRVPVSAVRSFQAMLLENVIEGCVKETFGALLAHWQSSHAADPEIRKTMDLIADDETRHAALAWDIDRWAADRLSTAEREQLAIAREQTVATLMNSAEEADDDVRATLGFPSAVEAAQLATRMQAVLWN